VPDALKILKKNRFDLVVMDSHTLRVGPSTIVGKIKGIGKGLPVVIIKAQEEEKPPKAFQNTGADLVIGLPLDMDRIPQLISPVLSNP